MKDALKLIILLSGFYMAFANSVPVCIINASAISEKIKAIDSTTNVIKKNQEESTLKILKTNNRTHDSIFQFNTSNYQTDSLNLFNITAMHSTASYETRKQYTLLIAVENLGKDIDKLNLEMLLPEDWSLISLSSLNILKENEHKFIFLSFYIPSNSPQGLAIGTFIIKNNNNFVLQSANISFNIAANYDLNILNIHTSQNVRAGEDIKSTFAIRNNGNITQEINLKSRSELLSDELVRIAPDSTVIVKLSQKTDAKKYSILNLNTGFEAVNTVSGKNYRAYKNVNVFPVKIKQQDTYFRYPIKASLIYSSITNNEHYSTTSVELRGNGYLDLDKNHHLNFIIRGPKKLNSRYFGVEDQYSLTYQYKDLTTIYLGDHSYRINRLGFTSRYGMGFRINQEVNDFTLSAFYSKPRLYNYSKNAVYGIKGVYHINDSLSAGVSLSRSKTLRNFYGDTNSVKEKEGQIVTFDFNYKSKKTNIQAESSTSLFKKQIDVANFIRLSQRIKNFIYTGNYTMAGKNYLGTMYNSQLFSNHLSYIKNKWTVGIGHSLTKVHEKLDPLYFAAQPYSVKYYSNFSYTINKQHRLKFKVDKRIREDQLEPKNYHYKEYGLGYNYHFNSSKNSFSANFSGRIGKTQNLLSDYTYYRNTYYHTLNLSYRFENSLSIRTSLNHNYSNRYGNTGNNRNDYRYSAGFNYNLNRDLRIYGNYNSGFSPEKNYLQRDFINAGLLLKINKNHEIELRANYYENPGIVNNKEFMAFGKYTYTFGAPLKKVIEQGGILGNVSSADPSIKIEGIKIIASGKILLTDKDGNFEINNLPLGKNYILIDQSTLEKGVITSEITPYEVIVEEKFKSDLNIKLVKAASIKGEFELDLENIKLKNATYNLQAYIKIHNKDFTYYTETNRKGAFKFQNIVPGTYKLTLLSFKENNKLIDFDDNIKITVNPGVVHDEKFKLKLKERKIKFKNKTFKIGK